MSVEVWVGEMPEHSSERKAMVSLARALEPLNELCIMLVSFNVPDSGNIDLAIIKQDGIFVIELKHCESAVIGGINGDWRIVDSQGNLVKILNEGRRNPYNQVLQYRYGLMNFLEQNKAQFLPAQKASQVRFKDIKCVVAISPELHSNSQINVDWKVTVKGLNELHQHLFSEISRVISLTETEMTAIPKILNCTHLKEFNRLLTPIVLPFEIPWEQYLQFLIGEDKEWQRFYVPLNVTEIVTTRKILDIRRQARESYEEQTTDIASVIQQHPRVVLLGEPGSGKTTLLEHLAINCAEGKLQNKTQHIPILVKLNLYDKDRGGLLGLIKETLRAYQIQLDDTHIRDMLNSDAQFLFMFDGLNEISRDQTNDGVREIRAFLMTYPDHKYLISCREQDYTQKIEGAVEVNVQAFKREDVSSYFSKFFGHYTGNATEGLNVLHSLTPRLLDVATKPLLAYIIAKVAADSKGQLPESRASLFSQFIDDIIQREIDKGNIDTSDALVDVDFYLSQLAFKMHQEMRVYLQRDRARRIVREYWESLKSENRCSYSEAEIFQEVWNSRLLLRFGNGMNFWHQQFQEFFAAKQLSELLMNGDNEAFGYLTNSWWHEVTIFATDMMDEPSFVVEYIVTEENVPLVGRCLAGEAGVLAKEGAQKCVQKLIDSTNEAERILGVKMLGTQCRLFKHEPFAVKTLLKIVSEEERSLLDATGGEETLDNLRQTTSVQQAVERELLNLVNLTPSMLNPDVIDVLLDVTHLSPAARRMATIIIGQIFAPFTGMLGNSESMEKWGEQINQFLTERLDDPCWGVRSAAVNSLYKLLELLKRDKRIIESLENIVKCAEKTEIGDYSIFGPALSPKALASRMAFGILMEIGETKSEPDPDRISRRISEALLALENGDTRFGTTLALSRFEFLVTIREETEEIIKALGNECYEKLLILSLSRELDKSNIFDRVSLIIELKTVGSDMAIQPLIKHLGSFNIDGYQQALWDIRCEAASALVCLGSVAAIQALVDLLSNKEIILRFMAVLVLEIAKQSREARKLLKAVQFDVSEQRAVLESCFVGEAGVKIIQYLSSLRDLEALEGVGCYECSKEGDVWMVHYVILDILNLASRDVVIDTALCALDNEQSKSSAIWILGELGDRSVLPQLRSKLSDLDVHSEVNQAIQKIIQRSDTI